MIATIKSKEAELDRYFEIQEKLRPLQERLDQLEAELSKQINEGETVHCGKYFITKFEGRLIITLKEAV